MKENGKRPVALSLVFLSIHLCVCDDYLAWDDLQTIVHINPKS